VGFVASLYAALFGAAAIGKVGSPGGWSALASAAARRRSTALALTVGLPLAEAGAACLLLIAPRAGLIAAAGLLALLGAGVLALQGRVDGRQCSCFGALHSTQLGRGLAIRNFGLAAVAAVLAPAAGMTAAGLPYIALAAACAVLPLLAAPLVNRRRRAPAAGDRLARPGAERLVVVLAPGCGPCHQLATALGEFEPDGVEVLAAVAATGDEKERESILEALGTAARPGLAGIVEDWRIPGTPFGIRLNSAGVVMAAHPVFDADGLRELCNGIPAPAPQQGRSRREVLRTAAGAAAAPLLAPLVRVATAGAAVASQLTPDVDFDDNPKNEFTGSCNKFGDLIENRGVIGADGQAKKNAGGYTHAAGFESASSIQADVCKREERVTEEWKGYCPCDGKEYTDESDCKVECPKGLACFGVQCQETFRRVCIDALVDICVAQPKITISVLRWTPKGPGAGPKCKAMAARQQKSTGVHEMHHAQDVRDAVDETNALFSNRTIRKCGLTEAAARAAINAEIAKLVDQAKQEAYKRDGDKSADFHKTSDGRHGQIDCRLCEPAKKKRRKGKRK